jgi:hypothetical protein
MRYHAGLYEVHKYMHFASAAPLSRIVFMGRTIVLLKQDLPPRLTDCSFISLPTRRKEFFDLSRLPRSCEHPWGD